MMTNMLVALLFLVQGLWAVQLHELGQITESDALHITYIFLAASYIPLYLVGFDVLATGGELFEELGYRDLYRALATASIVATTGTLLYNIVISWESAVLFGVITVSVMAVIGVLGEYRPELGGKSMKFEVRQHDKITISQR